MKAPFGKRKKTPEDNADWFMQSVQAYMRDGQKSPKKIISKCEKYIRRMQEIVNGKWDKWPNTLGNMVKIADEFGKNASIVIKIYSNLENFSGDSAKAILNILDELIQLETDPNPLSSVIAIGEEEKGWDINLLIDKLTMETKSNNYTVLLKILTVQPELHKLLLSIEVLDKIISNIESDEAHVSMNSSDVLESILISDNHQDIISKFIGENYEEVMNCMNRLIYHEILTNQVQGLKTLQEMINRWGSLKQFSEQYLQDKNNLKMVMNKMLDENLEIKESAFQLLIIYIYTPKDMKSDAVNETLLKNSEKLIELIEADLDKTDNETVKADKKEAIEFLSKIALIN